MEETETCRASCFDEGGNDGGGKVQTVEELVPRGY